MPRSYPAEMTERARFMRREPTEAEKRLWCALRRNALGVRFRRQEPKGTYILDFVCHEQRLVVEVDGHQHAANERRDRWLQFQGYRVLRFSNGEVLANLEGVVAVIGHVLDDGARMTPSLPPPGQGEES